jgi:4'-phosphopantetheinyl transferase
MNPGGRIWEKFNGNYALPEGEVHVWRTGLDITVFDIGRLRRILSPDEQERADRFHFEADRRRSIIGRGHLRLLLGEILGLPADSLQFDYDEFGKPRLMPTQRLALQFNVSHSGDLILIAISIGRAVGVDVERIRTDLDLDGVAARFFSANERKTLASLAGPGRYEAFFTCWTRKEAYLKARGVGLSLPLDQFDVSFLPDEEPRLLATRHDPPDAGRWGLRALGLSGGYVAALAAQGSNWKLKCWDWPAANHNEWFAPIK